MTNPTPTRRSYSRSVSLLLATLTVSSLAGTSSLAGPVAPLEEIPPATPTEKPPLEGITFADAPDRIYLPVLELAGEFGWKVKTVANTTDLEVNKVVLPRTKLRRLTAGTSLVSLQDVAPLSLTVSWDAAARVARVQHKKKSFAVRNGPKRVDVNQSAQRLRAWQGTRQVLETRVSTGRRDHPTPNGYFTAGPLKTPMLISRRYDNTPMPWSVQIRGNILFHGSRSVPPRADSHGCVRLPLGRRNVARWFYDWIPLGTPIAIGTSWPDPPTEASISTKPAADKASPAPAPTKAPEPVEPEEPPMQP